MSDDRRTMTRLFLRHREVLLGYVRALVRDPHDADELFQEVGVRVLELDRMPCLPEVFPAWCRGVARNLILHYWRSKRRSRPSLDPALIDALDLAYAESDAAELHRMRLAVLAECVERLPARSQELLDLRYARRMKSHEIARALGRSAVAVRKELSRLYAALSRCMESKPDLSPET